MERSNAGVGAICPIFLLEAKVVQRIGLVVVVCMYRPLPMRRVSATHTETIKGSPSNFALIEEIPSIFSFGFSALGNGN